MALSKAQLLAYRAPKIEIINVPEFGGEVCIRVMTVQEREQFERKHSPDPQADFRVRMICASVCDEEGNLLFTDTDKAEVRKWDANASDTILKAAAILNRMGPDEVEDEAKNLQTSPSDIGSSA